MVLLNVRNFKFHSNHRFQASHLPVADPAISSASEIPFFVSRLLFITVMSVMCGDEGYMIKTFVLWLL